MKRADVFPLIFLALLLFSLLEHVSFAQTFTASIVGTVKDETGAIILGVRVRIRNVGTNWQREVLSNEVGQYNISNLEPSHYEISGELEGFEKWTSTLTLRALQTAVVDIVLKVGEVTTTIEVSDSTPVINVLGLALGDVKEAERIRQLPLNGRDLVNLFTLTPGVERSGGAIQANGLRVGSAQYLMDGAPLEDKYLGSIVRIRPNLDAVREFRIETNGSSAEFSKPATVSFVTQSGTNEWHGALFETHRNNALRARSVSGAKADFLIRNEFGAAVGGPVRFPHLYNGQDRSFFFFSYEGFRLRQVVPRTARVPTEAHRNGDLSGVSLPGEGPITLYDPWTTRLDPATGRWVRDPFPNNRIPRERFNAVALRALRFYPLPNLNTDPYTEPNFVTVLPNNDDHDKITVRVDHKISDKDTLAVRYNWIDQFAQNPCSACDALSKDFAFNHRLSKTNALSLNWTRVFSSSVVNEFVIGGTRPNSRRGPPRRSPPYTTALGLQNFGDDTGMPEIYPGIFAGLDDDNPQTAPQFFGSYDDNFSINKGRHSIKLGFHARTNAINSDELGQPRGSYGFSQAATGLDDGTGNRKLGSGDGFATFLLGAPNAAVFRTNKGFFYTRQKEFGWYFQDLWRISNRLTLNFGLRYEVYTRFKDHRDQISTFDPASGAIITPGNTPIDRAHGVNPFALASFRRAGVVFKTAAEAGFPRGLFVSDRNNWAPRAGVAVRMSEKTVLRGGYGIYYWTMPLISLQARSRQNPPFDFRRRVEWGSVTDILRSTPPIIWGTPVLSESDVQIPSVRIPVAPFDSHLEDEQAQEWNVTLERELPWKMGLRVSYVGTKAKNLEVIDPINAAVPLALRPGVPEPERRKYRIYADLPMLMNVGRSRSDLFQLEVNRPLRSGVIFQSWYVFGRALGNSESGEGSSGNLTLFSEAATGQTLDERLKRLRGNLGFMPRHKFSYNFLIDLPLGRGHGLLAGTHGVVGKLIEGWQVASIGTLRSGLWFTPGGADFDLVKNPRLSSDQRTFDRWFDTTAIVRRTSALAGIPGNVGRNILSGPRAWAVDFSLFKNTRINERVNTRFTADFFNLFNHPTFGNPNAVTGRVNTLVSTTEPRLVQFSFRVEF